MVRLVATTVALCLSSCASTTTNSSNVHQTHNSSVDSESTPSASSEDKTSAHNSTPNCTVTSKLGLGKFTAHVSDGVSVVKYGLSHSRAHLEGETVRVKGLGMLRKIGTVKPTGATLKVGLMNSDLDPVVDGQSSFKYGMKRMKLASQECSDKQVYLGGVHIGAVAVVATQQ